MNNSNSTKVSEEKHIEDQPSQNDSVIRKTINEQVEPVTSPIKIDDVPIEEFIQTGVELYEKIKIKNTCSIINFNCEKDEVGILNDTLEGLYNIYYQYFNK